jgi:hypothetical protein
MHIFYVDIFSATKQPFLLGKGLKVNSLLSYLDRQIKTELFL